jgi:glycosyltransferase involved in cell wall biosynthesis
MPTLSEAENLPHVLPLLPEGIHELIVVDGLSADDTVEIARTLYPQVQIIFQDRRGKGNALACGISAASGEIIVTLDSDGSTDPRELPRFIEAIDAGADFVKGSRFLPGGGSADITLLRRVGNFVLTRLVNLLFGTGYTDLCYGFNAFRTDAAETLAPDADGFEIETLLSVRAAKAGLTVVEVPSWESRRIHGTSNLSTFRDGWRVLRTILREWRTPLSPSVREGSLEDELHSQARAKSRGEAPSYSPFLESAGDESAPGVVSSS